MSKWKTRPLSDDEIIQSYGETHSVYKTAAALGTSSSTCHRVLTRHNVPRVGLEEGRLAKRKFRGNEMEVRLAYESGLTIEQLAKKFGAATHYAFKSAVKRAGGVLRENPIPRETPEEVEKVRVMHESGMGQTKISLALGRSQSFISRLMKNYGIPAHTPRWETHPNWNGGRLRVGQYIRVLVQASDPMASMRDTSGYAAEHRIVMARSIGRPLRKSETVHHINGITDDNRVENLQLRQGKHGKHIAMCCGDCGSKNVIEVPLADGVLD